MVDCVSARRYLGGDIGTGMLMQNKEPAVLSEEEKKNAEPSCLVPLGRQGQAQV